MTIADYCAAMDRKEIVTNPDYQRSDKVWPPAARAFLIETIMQGFPIPKIFLFQKTDLKSKKTIKEIVDGQQRSKAIHDFFGNQLRLSKQSEIDELRGKTYDELDDEYKGRFLDYALSIDLFVGVTATEIREAFRRLNSYTVPLNPEEKRNAEYQGTFKWFVYRFTRKHEKALLTMGVLSEKQIVRMQDTKLVSELVHALLNGIRTTKSSTLDNLYKAKDKEFPEEREIAARLDEAFELIISLADIHQGPLMKTHVFYSLVLAASQALRPTRVLNDVLVPPSPFVLDRGVVLTNLTALAEALESDIVDERFVPFVNASTAKTNVEKQRKERATWLGKALLPTLL